MQQQAEVDCCHVLLYPLTASYLISPWSVWISKDYVWIVREQEANNWLLEVTMMGGEWRVKRASDILPFYLFFSYLHLLCLFIQYLSRYSDDSNAICNHSLAHAILLSILMSTLSTLSPRHCILLDFPRIRIMLVILCKNEFRITRNHPLDVYLIFSLVFSLSTILQYDLVMGATCLTSCGIAAIRKGRLSMPDCPSNHTFAKEPSCHCGCPWINFGDCKGRVRIWRVVFDDNPRHTSIRET